MTEQEILDELERRIKENCDRDMYLADDYDRAQFDMSFVQMAALLISMRRDMGVGDEA